MSKTDTYQELLIGKELSRIYWYNILPYLTIMTEVTYREYKDDSQYRWVKPMIDKIWGMLD